MQLAPASKWSARLNLFRRPTGRPACRGALGSATEGREVREFRGVMCPDVEEITAMRYRALLGCATCHCSPWVDDIYLFTRCSNKSVLSSLFGHREHPKPFLAGVSIRVNITRYNLGLIAIVSIVLYLISYLWRDVSGAAL